MLLSLSVKNFILIGSLNLDFSSGFHAISGETGSGKSMIIKSILFGLGFGKDNNDIVRPGAESASVVLEFSVSDSLTDILDHYGISANDSLFIRKQQFLNNKKKYYINDELTSHKVVSAIADHIIEIHGQHGYSRLLNPNEHIRILDNFANLIEDRKELEKIFYEYQKVSSEVKDVIQHQSMILRDIDYLSFVVSELKKKCPKKGEEDELSSSRTKLRNKSKRSEIIDELDRIIRTTDISSHVDLLYRVIAKNSDESLKSVSDPIEQLHILLTEVESEMQRLQSFEPEGDLESVEARLFEIRELSRKYDVDSDELGYFLKKSEKDLESLKEKIENSDRLSVKLDEMRVLYLKRAALLTEQRREASYRLELKIMSELNPLKMVGAEFSIQITSKGADELSASGMDQVRFMAATNPGSDLMPIEKCASGGEMARLMLAIRLALFDQSGASTIIFDEIDSGMGGVTADAVGARIKHLSTIVQTIAITHQPQVASKADHNVLVTKESSSDSTISIAQKLSDTEKKAEIARMISGSEITAKSIEAATELIDQ
jgi:DNA repair protein RecN (Recombination protein N)